MNTWFWEFTWIFQWGYKIFVRQCKRWLAFHSGFDSKTVFAQDGFSNTFEWTTLWYLLIEGTSFGETREKVFSNNWNLTILTRGYNYLQGRLWTVWCELLIFEKSSHLFDLWSVFLNELNHFMMCSTSIFCKKMRYHSFEIQIRFLDIWRLDSRLDQNSSKEMLRIFWGRFLGR